MPQIELSRRFGGVTVALGWGVLGLEVRTRYLLYLFADLLITPLNFLKVKPEWEARWSIKNLDCVRESKERSERAEGNPCIDGSASVHFDDLFDLFIMILVMQRGRE